MAITDLIPWKKAQSDRDKVDRALRTREGPLSTLEQQMNRIFDDFFQGAGLEPFGAFGEGWDVFSPQVDVVETDKEIKISAELPALKEKDIDLGLSQNAKSVV